MSETLNARVLQLNLTISTPLADAETTSVDLSVEVDHRATVEDLTKAVARHLGLTCLPSFGLMITYRRRQTSPEGAHAVAVYLPRTALVMNCQLVDGASLWLHDSNVYQAQSLLIDDDGAADDLYLVDERGTWRGRATRLPVSEPVEVGATPAGPRTVVTDDNKIPAHSLTLTNVDGESVECSVHDADGLYLLGSPAEPGHVVLQPGSAITFRAKEADEHREQYVDRVSFRITTVEGLHGRSPAGKVQLDPSTRADVADFPSTERRQLRASAAPELPDPRAFPFEQLALPLTIAVAIFFLTRSPYTILIAPIAALFPVFAHFRQKRDIKRNYEQRRETWKKGLQRISRDITELAAMEEDALIRRSPNSTEWGVRAYRRLAGTWTRTPERDDFMTAHIGNGNVVSRYGVELEPTLNVDDQSFVETIATGGRVIRADIVRPQLYDVPVSISLLKTNVAVVGPFDSVRHLTTDMLLQIVCAHPPGALTLAALLPDSADARSYYDWLKWLPHIAAGSQLLPPSRVRFGRLASNQLLTDLLRTPDSEAVAAPSRSPDHYALLVVHEASEVDLGMLESVCARNPAAIRVLWIGTTRDNAPQLVTCVVGIKDREEGAEHLEGTILSGAPELVEVPINIVQFRTQPQAIARSLAPLFDPRSAGASAGVPARVPLSAVIPLHSLDRGQMKAEIEDHCIVPLGLQATGRFELDLVVDGPHVLIAGTTGSGKSELLQTFVSGLCSRYSPRDVSLMLIDFKGGATFAPFSSFPHVIGYVSDLDQLNVKRALTFLLAELRRREERFADLDNAKDYGEYVRAAKSQNRTERLPRLVVVFDEYATLMQEHEKDTGRTVIDIAQRGRSLGVHIVFATQQPSRDVIPAKVRANVRAAIALHTVNAQDSELIIGRPDAARIPRSLPGRALVSRGEDELLEFQTAHGGALAYREIDNAPVVSRVFEVSGSDEPTASFRPGEPVGTEFSIFKNTVAMSADIANHAALSLLPALEDAPRRLALPAIGGHSLLKNEVTPRLEVGLSDIPQEQDQQPVFVDLRQGGAVFIGPGRSGRSTALLTVACLTAGAYGDASDLAIAVLSPTTELGDLLHGQGLAHRTALCTYTNLQATTRLIDQLWLILQARLGDETSQAQSGHFGNGPILVTIDGYDVLIRTLEAAAPKWLRKVLDIITLGRQYEIFIAIAATSARDISLPVLANQNLVIRLHEHYAANGTAQDSRLPGYGLDGDDRLVQLYLPPRPMQSKERVAPLIAKLLNADAWRSLKIETTEPSIYEIELGPEEVTCLPYRIDLSATQVLIIGGAGSGRTSLLHKIASELWAKTGQPVLLFTPRDQAIKDEAARLTDAGLMELYSMSDTERRSHLAEHSYAQLPDGRFLLLVDDAHALSASSNTTFQAMYDSGLVQPVVATTAQAVQSGFASRLRNEGVTVYLRPSSVASDFDSGSRARSIPLRHRPGRAYRAGDCIVQSDYEQCVIHLRMED